MLSVKDEVAKNLLYYRKKSGITQKSLAESLGVKHNSISAWESGTNSIDIDTLFRICEIFNVSVNDMYGVFANSQAQALTQEEKELLLDYQLLSQQGRGYIRQTIKMALSTYPATSSNIDYYRAAKSEAGTEHEVVANGQGTIEKLKQAKPDKVKNKEDF